ncbi:hypothetical protein, partial [Bacteroides gallinarum]|uniref:hypothetical protein n=1 Tax=Bacteroides gallinarum TaxID=376806 RepID=UPI0019D07153
YKNYPNTQVFSKISENISGLSVLYRVKTCLREAIRRNGILFVEKRTARPGLQKVQEQNRSPYSAVIIHDRFTSVQIYENFSVTAIGRAIFLFARTVFS